MYGGETSGGDGAAAAAVLGGSCCYVIFIFVFVGIMLAGMWKIYAKAGQPGWAALIPIYNLYVATQIVGRETWWMFVYWLVPVFGQFMLAYDFARSFGKDTGYAVGMFLLAPIFYPMLGFGKAQYVGPAAAGAGGYTPPPPTYSPPAPPAPPAPPTYEPPAPPAPPAPPVG